MFKYSIVWTFYDNSSLKSAVWSFISNSFSSYELHEIVLSFPSSWWTLDKDDSRFNGRGWALASGKNKAVSNDRNTKQAPNKNGGPGITELYKNKICKKHIFRILIGQEGEGFTKKF